MTAATAAVRPTQSSVSPAPAATIPQHEARAQVLAVLRRSADAPLADHLCEHVFAHYGDAGFGLQRAAAEAIQRRLQIAIDERLSVVPRPVGDARGDYRTRRAGEVLRPYRTRVLALQPLVGSCDCPDFRGNSLGVCKHVLAVLLALATRASAWQRAAATVAAVATTHGARPALRWHPFKPFHGDGDWLRQVELLGPATALRAAAGWRALLLQFTTDRDGRRWLRHPVAPHPEARLRLVDTLAAAAAGEPGDSDPALQAQLADEQQRLHRVLDLQPVQRELRAMRGFRRKLYPYQREGVARFLASGRLLLADDMGLGKTTQAVAICHLLARRAHVRRALLVVPAALKPQWLREWRACTALPIAEVEGPPEQRTAFYRDPDAAFLLTNYELLLRDIEVVKQWQPDLVLLDEAQRIKNWETRTAATIKQLEPRFRLVLTGTPFENRIVELDSILEWIDRRPLQPLWRLLPFHEIEGEPGLRHLDVLRQRLAPVLLRRRRQDVLDQLPGRCDTRVDVPLTAAQADEHEARTPDIAALLHKADRRPLTRPEFLRLMSLFTEQRLLANGMAQFAFAAVWPGIEGAKPAPALLESLSMPKLGELRVLLQQLVVDQGRKVVVFSQWRRALQLAAWAVGDLLARAGVGCTFFTGGQSQRRRTANLVAFHDDPAVRVLFATDAGGVGLNLQHAASCCVHFDLPWNPAVFEQRVGRIWRLGQREKVDVYSLVSEGCIESRIAELLRGKQAAFSALFDSSSDEVRFEARGGFLAAARRLVGGVGAVGAGARGRTVTDEEVLEVAVAGTAGAARTEEPEPDWDALEEKSAGAPLDAAHVKRLLAGLVVKPRSDGGMVLEADRGAAVVLAEVLRGLAGVIAGAIGGDA